MASIFPSFPGLGYKIPRQVMWSTDVQESIAGLENRLAYYVYPRYMWTFDFSILRSNNNYTELQQLIGFYNLMQGQFNTFLYADPDDYSVSNQTIGTGTGNSTQFQLIKSFGGSIEPVLAPNLNGNITINGQSVATSFLIYKDDWQGNQLQYSSARTNLVLESQDIGDSAWNNTSASSVRSSEVAPDGTTTATAVSPHSQYQGVGQNVAVSGSTKYTLSVFLQGHTGNSSIALQYFDGVNYYFSSCALTSSWQRFSLTFTATSSPTSDGISIQDSNASGFGTFYAWGCQLELGSSATSYIATGASSVTVTDYSVATWGSSNPGMLTFAFAPLSSATITGTFTYYYPCRFNDDKQQFTLNYYGAYSAAKNVDQVGEKLMKYITSSLTALFATRQYQVCGLYSFSLVGAVSSLYYASADVDIYLNSSQSGGDTRWTNQLFVHNQALFDRKDNRAKLSSAIGTQVSNLLFDVIPAGATIEGQPFLSFVRGGGFDGAVLTYYGAYWPYTSSGYANPIVPTGIINKFVGRVAEVDVGRNLATFSVNCHLELLNIQMPRNLYQAPCVNSLYDAGCTLSQNAFTVSSTALSASTSSTIYVSSLGNVSSYALGQITFTSGVLNGVSRTVQSYTMSSISSVDVSYLSIVPPFPSSPSSGDTFTISQGCDKTTSTCIAVFNNLLHYRGTPFCPSPDTAV